jgi:hypothetical protein
MNDYDDLVEEIQAHAANRFAAAIQQWRAATNALVDGKPKLAFRYATTAAHSHGQGQGLRSVLAKDERTKKIKVGGLGAQQAKQAYFAKFEKLVK